MAVVNHRHGTPDWMPIQLKLRDDLDEAMAAYKHYDVLLVNAMFDGMNLVAKEGPLVNEREGVSILSENTGAHEELGEYALSVNPFDIQELANSIYAALTMDPERAPPPGGGPRADRHLARPGRLDRRAARRHPREGPLELARRTPWLPRRRPRRPATRSRPHDAARDHIRPRAARSTPARRTRRARRSLADARSAIEAGGELAAPRRVGRASARLPDRPPQDAPSTTCSSSTPATPSCSSGLDRTLRITDGVVRFRIIKLGPACRMLRTCARQRPAAPRARCPPRARALPPSAAPPSRPQAMRPSRRRRRRRRPRCPRPRCPRPRATRRGFFRRVHGPASG